METSYIVRGLDKDGNEFVYTGKAGKEWIVDHTRRAEAFTYQTKERAQAKARQFNEMTQVHGVRFIAVCN